LARCTLASLDIASITACQLRLWTISHARRTSLEMAGQAGLPAELSIADGQIVDEGPNGPPFRDDRATAGDRR